MAIFTAIGSAVAGALFAAGTAAYAITASVVGAVAAFGAQLAFSYLTRPKAREYSAVQGEKQFGGDVPAGALFGKGKVVGQFAKYMKWGSGNKYNLFAYVLSNGWCDGLEPYCYFYGERHVLLPQTVDGNEQEKYHVDGFDDNIVIRFHDGRPGQLTDERMLEISSTTDNTWTTTDRLSGMAYVTIELRYDSDTLNKGMPEFEWVMRGLRCYDWRKDSTVAGGSGAHRLNDSSTWEYTENPAVQRFNYQIGIRGLISSRTIIGEGKSIGQLDLDTYTAAANVSDQDRTVEGRTFKRYQSGIYVTGHDDHTEILAEFDDAMAGYAVNRRGLSGIIVGAAQIPVMELDADDIDMERGKAVRYRKSVYEKFNHLSGQFISIEENWNPASLDPIHVNTDVASDKRVSQTSNDFLQVSDPDVAQYLLTVRYRQQRLGGSITLPVLRNAGFRVQEGDWVTYRGRDWLVNEWQIDESADITLILVETSVDIYDDETIDPGPIIIPSSPPINAALLTTIQNLNVEIGSVIGPEGYEIPALRCTWTPPADPTIVTVRFEYVIGDDPVGETIYRDRTDDAEAGEYLITKEVVPFARHTVRATITTTPPRFTTFTAWVTTADPTGPMQVYPPGLVENIEEFVGESTEWLRTGVRELIDNVKQSALLTIDQDAANYNDKQILRRELKSGLGRERAAWSEAIFVATGPGSAIAQRLETLEVEIDEKASVVALNALTARVDVTEDGISALVSDVTQLEIEIGTKASVTALDALVLRVDETEDSILLQAGQITSIEAELDDKASASTVLALSNTVSAQGDDITALSDLVGLVEAQVGDVTASGVFRVQAQASPGDGWARIGFQASADDGVTFETAAAYLDARTTGAIRSRFGVVADQFFVTDGTNEASPLVFQGGVLMTDELRAGDAFIANLIANDLTVLGTSNLDFGAVTDFPNTGEISWSLGGNFGWTTIDSITVPGAMTGGIMQIVLAMNLSDQGRAQMRVYRPDLDFTLYLSGVVENSGSGGSLYVDIHRMDPYSSETSVTYNIQVQSFDRVVGASTSVTGSVVLFYGKR